MKRGPSLQRRLSIGLAVGVTLLWLVAALVASFTIVHELDEAFDSALASTAHRILSFAAMGTAATDVAPVFGDSDDDDELNEHLTYQVRDRAGDVVLQSYAADPANFPKNPVQGFQDTATHRVYGATNRDGALFIEIAEPLEERREAAAEAAVSLVTPLPLLVVISLLGIWWFVRRSMRPVRDLKLQIEARGEGDLSAMSTEGLPREISPMANAVNQLMERLRRALEAERNFTANSAHELRTPIAAALAQTQRLISESPDGDLQDRARRIETSLHQLTQLSERLMQLARIEGAGVLSDAPQDLAPVLPHVVDEFREGEDGSSRLRLTMPDGCKLRSRMDPDAFAILMRNLIANALTHGDPVAVVEVVAGDGGPVRVINAGPRVSPETMARLKGRFERGLTDAKGAGLGLAIAEAIAVDAGATLDLLSPATDRTDGFEAVLHLPKTPVTPRILPEAKTL